MIFLIVALSLGLARAQLPVSKLNGKTVYLHRQFVDDTHAGGFIALKNLLLANAPVYGYKLEISEYPLAETPLSAAFNRLYRLDAAKPPNPIDVLVFSQSEGDWNITGNPTIVGWENRIRQVNDHVRAGGGLILSHAAGGRQISRNGWIFGAMLMTDWFQDEYFPGGNVSGNSGHFPSGTQGTITLDEQTLPSRDSSAYFIRRLMTLGKAHGGFEMPAASDSVRSSWYHFNGGFKYPGQLGGKVKNTNNKFQPAEVRGHAGFPDSGIGPSKVFTSLPRIQTGLGSYTPQGKGLLSAWGREVGPPPFDPSRSATNGRFAYVNPGHMGEEYLMGDGWMGNLFLSVLRWSVKDDRGCVDPASILYNPHATVTDGSCLVLAMRQGIRSAASGREDGRISPEAEGIEVEFAGTGGHSLRIVDARGSLVFARAGKGPAAYSAKGLSRGPYFAHIREDGEDFNERIDLP
jgi:hypothetical protein